MWGVVAKPVVLKRVQPLMLALVLGGSITAVQARPNPGGLGGPASGAGVLPGAGYGAPGVGASGVGGPASGAGVLPGAGIGRPGVGR